MEAAIVGGLYPNRTMCPNLQPRAFLAERGNSTIRQGKQERKVHVSSPLLFTMWHAACTKITLFYVQYLGEKLAQKICQF